MDETRPRVAIYCRLSEEDKNKTNKEDDSVSIQNQKLILTNYSLSNNWNIKGIYSDDDYTGADRNRPNFQKVIKLAKDKEIDIILCKSQSRFTRELELVEKYINGLFIEWGVRFIGLADNADTNIKGNKKSRQINGLVNEWYLEDLSDNIKAVLKAKREKGLHTGGLALYGYLKDPYNKGHLIIDPIASSIVKEIFSLYNQGYGKTAIARILNNKGIPNPTQYKIEQGIICKIPKNKLGTLWKYSSIQNILSNEMYIGNMVQGKYGSISYKSKKNKPKPKEEWIIVKGTHEAIVDINLWKSVQNKLQDNFKPFTGGEIGLFAKKCKCKYCGYTLKTSKSHNHRYLRCPTRQVDKNNCIGSFISENILKEVILRELNLLIEKYINIDEFKKKIALNKYKDNKEQLRKEISLYEINIKKYSRALKNLYIDKVSEVISPEEYITLSSELKKEKEKIEKIRDKKTEELLKINKEKDIFDLNKKQIKKYIKITNLTREMIDNLIDYIVVSRKKQNTKQREIEIHWKI